MLELKDYQKVAVRKLKENIVDMLGWEVSLYLQGKLRLRKLS